MSLDQAEISILKLLQNDGRVTNQELADKINLNFGTTFDKEDVEHYYDKYYPTACF